jgi:hypothetical protein
LRNIVYVNIWAYQRGNKTTKKLCKELLAYENMKTSWVNDIACISNMRNAYILAGKSKGKAASEASA